MQRHSELTVLGKPFLSIGGQVHNSSGYASKEGMETSFRSVRALGGNTIAVPVCWDAFEPAEGAFDTGYVRAIIDGARGHGLHLVLLWFGSWKNGTMEYTPAWVKQDRQRFVRVRFRDGTETPVLSPHAPANREQDEKAFCRLVAFLRDYDAGVGTVIALQVENEPGIYAGTRRDFGPLGQADYDRDVPREVIQSARDHPESALGRAWQAAGGQGQGSWGQVLGGYGAEACTAWHLARYIDQIAQAGKALYDLFMYTNVWLDSAGQYGWDLAGLEYPSGGPVSRVLEIWYAACPHLDAISPDIYHQEQQFVLQTQRTYANPDRGWPLYVPESGAVAVNATLMFHALGTLGAIGYHIFAAESCLDDQGGLVPTALPMQRSMRMLTAVDHLILRHRRDGRMHALYQFVGQDSMHLALPGWKCWASFTGAGHHYAGWTPMDWRHREAMRTESRAVRSLDEESGRGLLFQVADNEFYLVGQGVRLFFNRYEPQDGSIPPLWLHQQHQCHATEMLRIEEGHFEGEEFIADRRRSGDEARHGIWAQADCGVIHFILGGA